MHYTRLYLLGLLVCLSLLGIRYASLYANTSYWLEQAQGTSWQEAQLVYLGRFSAGLRQLNARRASSDTDQVSIAWWDTIEHTVHLRGVTAQKWIAVGKGVPEVERTKMVPKPTKPLAQVTFSPLLYLVTQDTGASGIFVVLLILGILAALNRSRPKPTVSPLRT